MGQLQLCVLKYAKTKPSKCTGYGKHFQMHCGKQCVGIGSADPACPVQMSIVHDTKKAEAVSLLILNFH